MFGSDLGNFEDQVRKGFRGWGGFSVNKDMAVHVRMGSVPASIFFFLFLLRATCVAYGASQARGPIRAAAAGLHHSHSHVGSEPCL